MVVALRLVLIYETGTKEITNVEVEGVTANTYLSALSSIEY